MDEEDLKRLRSQAKQTLQEKKPAIAAAYKNCDVETLLEEVSIYHAELEAQNEELREKQWELMRSQQEHKLLFDHAPIGYVVLDAHYNIIRANIKASRELALHNHHQMDYKRAFIGYIAKGHVQKTLDWLKSDKNTGESLEVKMLVEHEARWFEVRKNLMADGDNVQHLMITLLDAHEKITLRHSMEERIVAGIIDLREKESLLVQQSKMAEMGHMIDAIIHQWKQPLNVIVMTAGMVRAAMDGEIIAHEGGESFERTLLEQAHFMSDTMNDFRNFFKLDQRKVEIIPCQLLEKIRHMFRSLFEKYNVDIVVLDHDHFMVKGRTNEFMQVLLNIFNNARDAILAQEKPGRRGGKIVCGFTRQGDRGVIRIRDDGGGIPEDLLPDKLFQARVSTKGNVGTGIGLQISRQIIEERMGGKLWAHNAEGGAEFVIELPLLNKP